jgi:hypothetical protein
LRDGERRPDWQDNGSIRFPNFDKILGHGSKKCKLRACMRTLETLAMLYFGAMYARRFKAAIVIGDERRPMPLDWLDSFCMRNFTGSGEFDDTLPTAEGSLEVGLGVDPTRLAEAMSEWLTKRGKGNGKPVKVELTE